MYNILVVDYSALMRKVTCDIINSIQGFSVTDTCGDGQSAITKIHNNRYDAIVMNVYLPGLSGQKVIDMLKKDGITIPVIAMSTSVKEDRDTTLQALEIGAVDLVAVPFHFTRDADKRRFETDIRDALFAAVSGRPVTRKKIPASSVSGTNKPKDTAPKKTVSEVPKGRYGLVAVASSTGGPQALHTMIPMLPAHLGVPVVVVQHMPKGFTASLAERIDSDSRVHVKEAEDGEILKPDWVYIAPGGRHLQVVERTRGVMSARVFDDPPVNNLRPCADVMYDSLQKLSIQNILCVVLTGMGADGSRGISALRKVKNTYTITQDEMSCVVYGMPKSAVQIGVSDEVQPITKIADSIKKELGV